MRICLFRPPYIKQTYSLIIIAAELKTTPLKYYERKQIPIWVYWHSIGRGYYWHIYKYKSKHLRKRHSECLCYFPIEFLDIGEIFDIFCSASMSQLTMEDQLSPGGYHCVRGREWSTWPVWGWWREGWCDWGGLLRGCAIGSSTIILRFLRLSSKHRHCVG